VYHGPRDAPRIALTFDDGPSESTPALLEILDKHSVRATFFMVGRNVRRCPEIAREVRARGHEIGNHTDTHPLLALRSPQFVQQEIAAAQKTIHLATGATPVWFRAPYGARWFGVGRAQQQLGLTGVMWTTIGRDWYLPAGQIAALVRRKAANGAIFCLHDGRGVRTAPDIRTTLDAVQEVIPQLAARGYRFQTLSQMLCPTN
jgi:peptidoglycan/xylan/chitin deacetylase (PgdA/CDA1 family)